MLPLQFLFGVKDLQGVLSFFLKSGIINYKTFKPLMEYVMANSSILDALKNSSFAPATKSEKPASEFWLNIGYMAEDGEHFVSLTKGGIPLDNMEPEKVSNPDSEYGQLLLASNYLLEALQNVAKQLMPGDARVLPDIQVQIRRKKEAVTTQFNGNNKFIKAMNF